MKFLKGFSKNQIKALLKKDLIVRLRQPWMTIMQFVWPCIIFISLYTLRHRFQPEEIPDCQFPTRQLPTKNNLLPFFHSYICTIENSCQDTKTYEEYSKFENAPLQPLLNIAQTFINEKSLYDAIINLPKNGNWISTVTTLALNPKFAEIQKNIEKIAASVPEVEKLIGGNFDIKKLWSDSETFSKAGNIICGKPFPRSDNIRFVNEIMQTQDLSDVNQDELDAMPTPYCKQLYRDVTASNYGKITWSQVKPIIQGKIIYGPVNTETLSIMKFANNTFEEMNRLQNLASSLDETIKKLHTDKTFSDNFMKLIEFAKSPLVKSLVGNSIDVGQIEAMLLRLKNDETIADTIRTVSNILECFSADRFISVHTENELRERSYELNKKRLYYGGVYFNQSAGNEIIYKIRVDTDNTPVTIETKNRFWFPGPEASMVEHMRYHRGFIQIKHSIDTGIIKHKKLIKFNEEKAQQAEALSVKNDDDWSDWNSTEDNHDDDDANKTNLSEIVGQKSGSSIDLSNLLSSVLSETGGKSTLDSLEFDEDFDETEPKVRKRRQLNSLLGLFSASSSKKDEVKYLMDDLKIYTKQFPYPSYTKDDFKRGLYLAQSVQMAFFMGLLIQIATCVRYRIWMKESKNTLLMRTMGLQASSEIISWIITTFTELLIVFIVACIILYSGGILQATGFLFILIFLIIFGICIISFCFMCSTIFSSASIGSVSTTIFFLMTFLPYIVIICLDTNISGILKFITNLSFSTAFCYAFDNIMRQELQGLGMSFTDAFANGLDSEFSYAFCMIILDTIIYAIIGYIVERIKNDEYKFHKVERDQLDTNIGATFLNVSKVYDDIKVAISNISLDFPKNKITCLLGRNGAGKSTILKMLTGQITPSSGKIILSQSLASQNDIDKIGLCSQDNILIPHLTAKEHLELYSRIKIKTNFKSEVDKTMKSLNLGKYENYEAYKLSGGYQRRLCVAIAFIGSPSVVILDEPCSSIDTKARKYVWELVEKLRKGRAVILATHFLDEAEYFSDSIVIINDGKIIAKHNPHTLKTLFTKSFELTIESNPNNMEILENIKNLMQKYLNNFKQIQQSENQMKIGIIYDPAINDCAGFLNELENLKNQNKIVKFSVASKNLESIFNNLNKGLEKLTNGEIKPNEKSSTSIKTIENNYAFKNNLNQKTIIRNLLWKRFLHLRRNVKLILCILILPAIFEIIAMSFMQLRPGGEYDTEINLSRNLYPDTTQFFSLENQNNYTTSIIDNLKIPGCIPQNSYCQEFPDSEKIFYWLLESESIYHGDRYGGITINGTIANVWYNNKGYHSMVSWLNDLNTNILRAELNNTDLKITTFNKPIKLGDHELSTSSILQQVSDAGISLILLIAFSLVAAGASVYLVNERVSGEKLQQKLCGVDFSTYWGVAYIWDFLIFLASLAICVIIFKIFNISIYVDRSQLNGICLLVVLYGFASIPTIHVFEKLFSEASIANMTIFCMNVIIALFTLTVILLFDILGESDLAVSWRHFLNRAFLIFPQHALADGLIEICKNYITAEVFIRYDIDTYKSPVSSKLLVPQFTALFIMGSLFIFINYIIESNNYIIINKKIRNYLNKKDSGNPVELKTVSIHDNSLKINDYTKSGDKYTLKVDNLEKSYKRGQYAVNDVSFQVNSGECFGLLGKNGAGKSTIFKIISGQIHQDGGSYTYLSQNISYCPQTIALDPLLTVKEVIKFYGNLRRINDITNLVATILKSFNLENYENVLVKNLSGGNRRKLNVAVSCIGDSSIILMDEPTSDMDPVTRCLVYKAINDLLANGKSVLLTSHAISEIDQVCQRIGILKDGKLINCGSPDDLKNQFGGYYNVTLFCDNNDLSALQQDIQIAFPQLQNIEIHPHSIKFIVKIEQKSNNENDQSLHNDGENDDSKLNDTTLSNLFANLNQFSSTNKINFSINRCRLDLMIEKLLNLNNTNESETGQCAYADNKGYINTET